MTRHLFVLWMAVILAFSPQMGVAGKPHGGAKRANGEGGQPQYQATKKSIQESENCRSSISEEERKVVQQKSAEILAAFYSGNRNLEETESALERLRTHYAVTPKGGYQPDRAAAVNEQIALASAFSAELGMLGPMLSFLESGKVSIAAAPWARSEKDLLDLASDPVFRSEAEKLRKHYDVLREAGIRFDPLTAKWTLKSPDGLAQIPRTPEVEEALAQLVSPNFREKFSEPVREETLVFGDVVLPPRLESRTDAKVSARTRNAHEKRVTETVKKLEVAFLDYSEKIENFYRASVAKQGVYSDGKGEFERIPEFLEMKGAEKQVDQLIKTLKTYEGVDGAALQQILELRTKLAQKEGLAGQALIDELDIQFWAPLGLGISLAATAIVLTAGSFVAPEAVATLMGTFGTTTTSSLATMAGFPVALQGGLSLVSAGIRSATTGEKFSCALWREFNDKAAGTLLGVGLAGPLPIALRGASVTLGKFLGRGKSIEGKVQATKLAELRVSQGLNLAFGGMAAEHSVEGFRKCLGLAALAEELRARGLEKDAARVRAEYLVSCTEAVLDAGFAYLAKRVNDTHRTEIQKLHETATKLRAEYEKTNVKSEKTPESPPVPPEPPFSVDRDGTPEDIASSVAMFWNGLKRIGNKPIYPFKSWRQKGPQPTGDNEVIRFGDAIQDSLVARIARFGEKRGLLDNRPMGVVVSDAHLNVDPKTGELVMNDERGRAFEGFLDFLRRYKPTELLFNGDPFQRASFEKAHRDDPVRAAEIYQSFLAKIREASPGTRLKLNFGDHEILKVLQVRDGKLVLDSKGKPLAETHKNGDDVLNDLFADHMYWSLQAKMGDQVEFVGTNPRYAYLTTLEGGKDGKRINLIVSHTDYRGSGTDARLFPKEFAEDQSLQRALFTEDKLRGFVGPATQRELPPDTVYGDAGASGSGSLSGGGNRQSSVSLNDLVRRDPVRDAFNVDGRGSMGDRLPIADGEVVIVVSDSHMVNMNRLGDVVGFDGERIGKGVTVVSTGAMGTPLKNNALLGDNGVMLVFQNGKPTFFKIPKPGGKPEQLNLDQKARELYVKELQKYGKLKSPSPSPWVVSDAMRERRE